MKELAYQVTNFDLESGEQERQKFMVVQRHANMYDLQKSASANFTAQL